MARPITPPLRWSLRLVAWAAPMLAMACGVARPLEPSGGAGVHSAGILDPRNREEFHGALVRAAGWQFSSCTVCHGEDFAGGAVKVSCLSCHPSGPTACSTCHAAQLTGAHQGLLQKITPGQLPTCLGCHPTPSDYRDPGHLFLADGSLRTSPIRVTYSGAGSCSLCHGNQTNAAPPFDLQGNTEVAAIGVGTHQSHLQASHRLRGPIPCADCHLVPTDVGSPGHIDSGGLAKVFPSDPAFVSLGRADGAQPQWDRQAVRCTNVYCHGGGTKLGLDRTPNLVRAPLWTQPGQAACGTCHGIPPTDANHNPTMRLQGCVTCHPATMDASGTLLVSGPPGALTSAHINGVVDVQ